ncbi:MAG: WG repeat-containing protein [Prevotella sp.]|nr:WG repeat-containing protein [Prevotella sp.]
MKKYIFVLSLIGLIASNAQAQQPVDVVQKFGTAMHQWCNTDEIEYHEQAMKLASGKIKCLVNDKITQDAVANDQSQLLTNGTQEIVSYLNIFQDAIMQGQKYDMSNVKARPDFVEPTAFKNDTPPSFVSADLALSGKLVYNVTDIFYVREGKITKIIDYSSDNSLGKALELYSNRKYDEAFKMFRKLAYADFGNFDAQYYMVVMEIKKQGCGFLDKKVRDKEVTWFIAKNIFAKNQDAVKLAIKFPLNEKQMDYAYYPSIFEWIVRCKQPAQSGLMMSIDLKTKTAGFVNESGRLVIPYGKYSVAFPYHEGRSLVFSKVTKRCGFIDEKGEETVPMIYEDAICDFYKGRTWCVKDGDAYLVDNQGKVLKTILNHGGISTMAPVGKYAMLYKTDKVFDIYDYNGNLCYQDYTNWEFNSCTGLVTMSKPGADYVKYKIEW